MPEENTITDSETGLPTGISYEDDAGDNDDGTQDAGDNDDASNDDASNDDDGTADDGDEGEPDGRAKSDKVKLTPQQQRVFDETIARKTAKFRERERALNQELEQLRQRVPQQGAPEVPARPSPWASNDEVIAYETALVERAKWDAAETQQQQTQQQTLQEKHDEAARELRTATQEYATRAKKQGIKPDQLQLAGELVYNQGINDQVLLYIVAEEAGPSITTYLSRHLDEVEKLQGMMPAQAAAYIASVIKPKATRRKPSAPPPADGVSGARGARREVGPKGATYE